MSIRVAINGFGRIGRAVFRRIVAQTGVEVVAINAVYPVETLAHLTQYDTIHGVFPYAVKVEDGYLVTEGQRVFITSEREPRLLPWSRLAVDIVIEATGQFRKRSEAAAHLHAGAKKVIITAPGKDEDLTVVMGVNQQEYNGRTHDIVSNASCTTNCLAPVVKVLHDRFGIEHLMMTTVHAFTSDQRILDNPHHDLRRARAATQSIVPTSTGAAKAVAKVLPDLEGRMTGLALRVPTPNVSLVDLVADLSRDTTLTEIIDTFQAVGVGGMKGIIAVCDAPLVSTDFVGDSHSAIIDAELCSMLGERKVKMLVWYDNEWGYSCRIVDLLKLMGEDLQARMAPGTEHGVTIS